VNTVGYPQRANGSGNGNHSRRPNAVKLSRAYQHHRDRLKAKYPRLVKDRVFEEFEAWAVAFDPQRDAVYLGSFTYSIETPQGFDPPLCFYFTYAAEVVKMQMVSDGEPFNSKDT
jgi:hypothetical protein